MPPQIVKARIGKAGVVTADPANVQTITVYSYKYNPTTGKDEPDEVEIVEYQ